MLAGAIHNALQGNEEITNLLGTYKFDPSGDATPSIFTADPLPTDGDAQTDPNAGNMLPALVITETVGTGLDGQRGRSAAEYNAEIKVVGPQDHAHENNRNIAAKIWDFLDKATVLVDPEGELDIIGSFAEPPQDLGEDDQGFPQFRVRIIATVYAPLKQEA